MLTSSETGEVIGKVISSQAEGVIRDIFKKPVEIALRGEIKKLVKA